MSTDTILFNISAFIAGLFVLERSADAFLENTSVLAKRLGIPEVLIALLTVGSEWEELVVVVASLIQHRPGLAVGTVIGSTISNILGAFSIGLLFQAGIVRFDRSSKLYTGILFIVTTMILLLALVGMLGKATGGILVAAFVLYVCLTAWSIYRGVLAAPENSDSDSDAGSNFDSSLDGGEGPEGEPGVAEAGGPNGHVTESSPLLTIRRRSKSVILPLTKLLLGLLALLISGYILTHTSSTLAEAFGVLDSVFGVTILSLATTLPEKFVAVFSGSRGHSGILVANTVGSNMFLLTLCLGITLLSAEYQSSVGLTGQELAWMWSSSLVLGATVVLGSHRIVGVLMLVAYLIFLMFEFTTAGS